MRVLFPMFVLTIHAFGAIVGGARNAASLPIAGTPFTGLAQGAVFVIEGSDLGGPAEPFEANIDDGPLPTALDPFSIQIVSAAGQTSNAILYSVSDNRVVAILPSSTPLGDATIVMQPSGFRASIKVVNSLFGILTLITNARLSGSGTVVATHASDESEVTLLKAPRAGEPVILNGTGLGADPSGADETMRIESPQDMEGHPLEIYVGTRKAEILYRGRSNRPGWDRVEIVIPEGVTPGCFVGIYAKTPDGISNFATIPVVAGSGDDSRQCTEQGFTPIDLETAQLKETMSMGWLSMGRSAATTPPVGPVPSNTTLIDAIYAGFVRFKTVDYATYGAQGVDPARGTCLVYGSARATQQQQPVSQGPQQPGAEMLDAGPFIGLTPPNGTMVRVNRTPGQPYQYSASPPTRPLFFSETAGTYKFTVPGGSDIGAFDVSIATGGAFRWTNRPSLATVSRTAPFEVTWTGGHPDSYVAITGTSSNGTGANAIATTFLCTEKTSAGRFAVPRDVLASMVQTTVFSAGPVSIPSGQMTLILYKAPEQVKAPSLDFAYINYYFADGVLANFP